MSVGTGSRNGGQGSGLRRELPALRHQPLLELHKELWVLGKVRKGKLGLGSVNRRVELQGTLLCGFSALMV